MQKMLLLKLPIVMAITLLSISVVAKDNHQHHTQHGHSASNHSATPKAPGNDAFAAVEEIVQLLLNDPSTDWTKVNIDALHSHLKDMHLFFLETDTVEPIVSGLSVTFKVTGNATSIAAIHRMLPAHSAYIEKIKPWKTHVTLTDDGASLRIDVHDNLALIQLKAIGLYGFMSLDSHHQAHHLMIATGEQH